MSEGLIIIPAFNEEKNIEPVLKKILSMDLGIDIAIVDDGSIDRTRSIVVKYPVYVISHLYNLGYGSALQTGFKFAREKNYKYVVQFDADGQHDTNDLPEMIEELKSGRADIVIGSRFLGRGNFKAGLLKKIVISMMRALIKIFTAKKVTDPTSGFKGLSRRTYEYYSIMGNFPNDYPDADLIIKMLREGYSVQEIPINVYQRSHGTSMHSGLKPIIYLLKILLSILVIISREKLLKGR